MVQGGCSCLLVRGEAQISRRPEGSEQVEKVGRAVTH